MPQRTNPLRLSVASLVLIPLLVLQFILVLLVTSATRVRFGVAATSVQSGRIMTCVSSVIYRILVLFHTYV